MMASIKFASSLVAVVLVICLSGTLAIRLEDENEVFKPSLRYLEAEDLFAKLKKPNHFDWNKHNLELMLEELNEAKEKHLELGEFENKRALLEQLVEAPKLSANKCPTVLGEIKKLYEQNKAYRSHLRLCEKVQQKFCKGLKKDLSKQEKKLVTSKEFNDARSVFVDKQVLDGSAMGDAIATIIRKIDEAEERFGGRLLPQFREMREKHREFHNACQPASMECVHIFKHIDFLEYENPFMKNYLDGCREVQKEYCQKDSA